MDEERARILALAGRLHAQGAVLHLLVAYCASKEPNPQAWLKHFKGMADREIKGANTAPELPDDEALLIMNVGLATVADLFNVSDEDASKSVKE